MAEQHSGGICQRRPSRHCACHRGQTQPPGGQQTLRFRYDRMWTAGEAHTFRTIHGADSCRSCR